MVTQFCLPDLGEGIHEAEILSINVRTGQTIREGEPLLEVETDKAAVEIPSPFTGRVGEILTAVGDIAQVGDPLITFHDMEQQTRAESLPEEMGKKRPVPASPSTRRLARELGVDLHLVTPTGSKGIVTADDVKSFAAAAEKTQQPATPKEPHKTFRQEELKEGKAVSHFSQWGAVEQRPFRSIRRATALKMAESWTTIPHVNCQDLVDVTLLEEFRQKHKDEVRQDGGRLTMTVFALKAAATALKTFPHFNASLDLAGQEIIIKHYFHIGIAVDTPHGLVVPVIRDVDRKSIKELAVELYGTIDRAKKRTCSREELLGGTFTITNAGAIGGGNFTAVINHPEIAILGLGQARMQPAVVTDDRGRHSIEPRLMMPIILCFDHRVVDGGDAIRFLQVIINGLQDPDELLMTMI